MADTDKPTTGSQTAEMLAIPCVCGAIAWAIISFVVWCFGYDPFMRGDNLGFAVMLSIGVAMFVGVGLMQFRDSGSR